MTSPNKEVCSLEAVANMCTELGFSLSEKGMQQLYIYLELVEKWNKTTNLVGTKNWQDTLRLLCADSLHLAGFLRSLPLPTGNCWDLGAGAGLPGIPLATVWQAKDAQYTLVELRKKRAFFMQTVLAHYVHTHVPMPHMHIFCGQAQRYMQQQVEAGHPAAGIISRAFMPWEKLLPFVQNSLHDKGLVIIMANIPAPLKELPPAWGCLASQAYTIATSTRYLWAVQKIQTGQQR